MASLVPIPWQPYYYVRPELLALLAAASDRRGVKLYLYTGDKRGLLSAWRSYAQQKQLWLDGRKTGVVASNPDSGQRSHMRGAAVDLILTDATTQRACRDVGLVRDPSESWHWNHPAWASMPIIPTMTTTAGSGATGLRRRKDNDNMILMRVTHPTNEYTEALLTDGIYSKTLTPVQAREYMLARPDLDHNADGGRGQFDTVTTVGVYAKFKALPSFPVS